MNARKHHPAIFSAIAASKRPAASAANVAAQEPDPGMCDCGREKSTLQDTCDECLNYQDEVESTRRQGIFTR